MVAALAHRHFEHGVRQQAAGDVTRAAQSFRCTLALWPDCAAAWANLGLLHQDAGEFDAARDSYERALALDPGLFEAALNLGALWASRGCFEPAEAAYRRALALRPGAAAAWSNLAALLACQRRDDDALACCRHALQLDPAHDKARFNMSYIFLRRGLLAEGFLCNEARVGVAELQSRLDGPRWAGEDLQGRPLLVVSDAAHGDLIQMARYGRLLASRGAGRVLLVGQTALKRLLTGVEGFDEVRGFDEPVRREEWELWTPAMSLPHLFRTRLDSIPAALPYLHADPARVAHWRGLLGATEVAGTRRIGIVWRGNPGHENDAERSLHDTSLLAPLGPLAERMGLRLISLQHGGGGTSAPLPEGLPLQQAPGPLGDFAETAALVANLDLVIGVDTSAVHLAGALGVSAWVLLGHYKTDWRWLEERSDSPWYPGVLRLFRQPQRGDWAAVVSQLAAALAAWEPGQPRGSLSRRAPP